MIRDLIYTVRGVQIMLDSDLAALYGVETKVFNQAVRRNIRRFPDRFRFQLTREEAESLRSQIVTSNDGRGGGAGRGASTRGASSRDASSRDASTQGASTQGASSTRGGRRYLPYAFTEQGVSMLSSVLRSDTAIEVSIRIIGSFVEMRHFISGNLTMFEQIRAVELRQLEYQRTTDERFERVFDYMATHDAPRQKVFFDGQVYDAFELLVSIVQRAERSITLVDGYMDASTLNILAKKRAGVRVAVWTHPRTSLSWRDVATFNAQYPELVVEHTTAFHDRFIILDEAEGYFVGASLKDAGKRSFAISQILDEATVQGILARLAKP